MNDIFDKQFNQEYHYLFNIQILILLILANLLNFQNIRIINNYDSEIHLIIEGHGNQNILYKDFSSEPSEVIINGYKNDSCKKTCYFLDDLNNITLKY